MATANSVFSVTIIGATDEFILDNNDIVDCYFIEDIYSYLMTGKITLKDTSGLTEFLPLVGNETIIIDYGTLEDGKQEVADYIMMTQTFNVVKMSNVESLGEKHRTLVELYFIQAPHKRLHQEAYSLSFKCLTYTDYVKEICKVHCGIDAWGDFEPCLEILQYFYTGLKTPAQNIEWLGSRCSGMISGQPGYLLFANTKVPGAPYNFVTLEKLLMMAPPMEPLDAGPYTIAAENQYNINNILRYKDNRVDKQALGGLMKGVGLGFDIGRKRYIKNEYSYMDALGRFTCLGDFSLFEEGIDELISVRQELTGESGPECELIMMNLYYGEWVKRYCLQHTVEMLVEGHSLRHAGGVLNIHWPSTNDDEIFNKTMSGIYLAKSITHQFSPAANPNYKQKIILIKNGYDKSEGNLTGAAKARLGLDIVDRSISTDLGIRV